MKIIIWLVSMIIATIINLIFAYFTGIRFGWIILYAITGAIAAFLSKKYDNKGNRHTDPDEGKEEYNAVPVQFKKMFWKMNPDTAKIVFENRVVVAWKNARDIGDIMHRNIYNVSGDVQHDLLNIYSHVFTEIRHRVDSDESIIKNIMLIYPNYISDETTAKKIIDYCRIEMHQK